MASLIFSQTVTECFATSSERSSQLTAEMVQDCFNFANSRILSHVQEVPTHAGIGCTAELMAFHGSGFVLGHVGDSRTYRLRQGRFEQLTCDHSFVQEQLELKLISAQEARKHPMRNVILRAVGNKKELEVDILSGTVLAGDIYLLCSDGLSDMVEDGEIQKILEFEWPLEVRATMLIDQANYAGGKDNVTVALIEVSDGQPTD